MPTARVIYHYEPEGWWAESPEYPEYGAAGGSLQEVRTLVHEGLPWFAEEPLDIVESFGAASAVFTTSCAARVMVPDYARSGTWIVGRRERALETKAHMVQH